MDSTFDWSVIDKSTVTFFTDGSCYPNPNGKGGWAYVGMWKEYYREASGHLPNTTNNQAELTAVLMALQSVKRKNLPILIITDSQYVYRSFTFWIDGWRRAGWTTALGQEVSNKDLMQTILDVMSLRSGGVEFRWMKGHTKEQTPYTKFNARADELASYARKNS